MIVFLMISSTLLTIVNCQPASKRQAKRSLILSEYNKTTTKPKIDCLLCYDFKAADGSTKNLCSLILKTEASCAKAGGTVN